ncbi:hypothetical protein [Candidatus Methylomirabilis sp.]|uniref:hypothetical protein n=1 Tax=Candidatus Methylomirabilis sp. TaxID=2032687 RepID=UPI003C7737FA
MKELRNVAYVIGKAFVELKKITTKVPRARSPGPPLADVGATLVVARSGQAQDLPLQGDEWGCGQLLSAPAIFWPPASLRSPQPFHDPSRIVAV